jgi:uncharacterized protein with ATP-grasp and redox domains
MAWQGSTALSTEGETNSHKETSRSLFKTKCPVIARNLGVNKGDTVSKYALARTNV